MRIMTVVIPTADGHGDDVAVSNHVVGLFDEKEDGAEKALLRQVLQENLTSFFERWDDRLGEYSDEKSSAIVERLADRMLRGENSVGILYHMCDTGPIELNRGFDILSKYVYWPVESGNAEDVTKLLAEIASSL